MKPEKEYTDKQKIFLDALTSEECKGNIKKAMQVAGYADNTGSDATIRIRGFGSINGNRSPLYIVDGAPYASDISAINPSDIANLTILKDAAATSIYGSRGAMVLF